MSGAVTATNMEVLDNDWTIEERCNESLASWQLADLSVDQPLSSLSGGQKTRVFLAGISLYQQSLL